MEHIYRRSGNDESMKLLWQNREALDKYLARLKELMEEDNLAVETNGGEVVQG